MPSGEYRLLPTTDDDCDGEVWEFPPESVVEVEAQRWSSGEILVAVQPKSDMADFDAMHDIVLRFGNDRRSKFLLNLANELTVVARTTYSPACDEVESPKDLRRYNETLHRVLANFRELLEGSSEELWTWNLLRDESRRLRPIISACRRALELTK